MTAIATQLEAIPDLQQSAYVLANPTAPVAELLPGQIEFDEAFSGGPARYEATIRVTVGTTLDIGAQKRLRAYRSPNGPSSVKAAVETDRSLGGLTYDLNVNRVGPVRNFRRPDGTTVLGCDFLLEYEGSGQAT